MLFHGAVIKLGNGQENHHYNGQQGIKVIGDGTDKELHTVLCSCSAGKAGDRRCPRRNGGDNADGSGCGVDKISELCSGNVVLVGDRAHNRTDSQAVEIVINENKHAQKYCTKLGPHTALDMFGCPAAKGGRSSGLVEHGHYGTEQYEEDENTDISGIGNGIHKAGAHNVNYGSFKIEVGIQQAAHKYTHEEGRIHLFGNKGQGNGNQRRKQSKEGGVRGNLGTHRSYGVIYILLEVLVALKIVGIAVGIVESSQNLGVLVTAYGAQVIGYCVFALSHRHRSGTLSGTGLFGGRHSHSEAKEHEQRENKNGPSFSKL